MENHDTPDEAYGKKWIKLSLLGIALSSAVGTCSLELIKTSDVPLCAFGITAVSILSFVLGTVNYLNTKNENNALAKEANEHYVQAQMHQSQANAHRSIGDSFMDQLH
jgi:hypothetical protein